MKTFGWICIVLGALSFLGAVSKGHSAFGPAFWLGLGIFLVYRAKVKKQEEDDKRWWSEGQSQK